MTRKARQMAQWQKDDGQECWRLKGRTRGAYVALSDEAPGWHWGASRDGLVLRSGRERKKADAVEQAERAMRNI